MLSAIIVIINLVFLNISKAESTLSKFIEGIALISKKDTNLMLLIFTMVYTIFTGILVLMNYRSNCLTRKVIANMRRPIIVPELIFGKDYSLSIGLENKSIFIANDIIIKIESQNKTIKSACILPSTSLKFYIKDQQKVKEKNNVNIKIEYKNEDRQLFKSYFKLDIPPSERRI